MRLTLKESVFYMVLLFSLQLSGQTSLQHDTILIREVEIRGKSVRQEFPGFKIVRIDSSLLSDYNQYSLADLISENSGIYIKTYGTGGLATASFRGTGAGHTQIAWNNISLNNPMVGQFDLSLIPSGFIDNISIYYGGGSMNIGSGGSGGIIGLETMPDWNNQEMISISPGFGSFGRISGLIKVKAGKSGFQSVTKAFINIAENDFPYLNSVSGSVPYLETRENSQVRQNGFIQEVYFRKLRSTYSARFWYQSAWRNLPVPIITPTMNPPEKQNDESLRAMVTYESSGKASDFNVTAAYISDKLIYENELVEVYSKNKSQRVLLKSDIKTRINEIMNIKFALGNDLTIIATNNYAKEVIRNVVTADAVAQADLTRWFSAKILVREILQDNTLLAPDFSVGAEIKPFREKSYNVKTSFSKNSRIPTLNDMYWSPGGNPDLKNETGYLSEITIDLDNMMWNSFKIKNDLTFFRNKIINMIQWHPGESSYWEADNLQNVVTGGLETSVGINYSVSRFEAGFNAGYTYTRAVSESFEDNSTLKTGNQVIYIPVHQFNGLLRINWRNFQSTINSGYTGKRFINTDNTSYLPAYLITDLNLGLRFINGNTFYNAGITIENLFDVNYQNIAYYPMPGRNYLLTVIFQFKK